MNTHFIAFSKRITENFKKGGIYIIEGVVKGIGFIIEPIGDLFVTFFDAEEIIKQGKNRQMSTGREPFVFE